MVTALRPIEVRTAAADEVPKVAAVLADAFINDPVFTFLRPGRLRQRARLRTMFVVEIEQYVLANGGTVWTTSGYDGAVAELPPGAWEMPKSATGKEILKWMWAFRTNGDYPWDKVPAHVWRTRGDRNPEQTTGGLRHSAHRGRIISLRSRDVVRADRASDRRPYP
jgi:hypothetical protein